MLQFQKKKRSHVAKTTRTCFHIWQLPGSVSYTCFVQNHSVRTCPVFLTCGERCILMHAACSCLLLITKDMPLSAVSCQANVSSEADSHCVSLFGGGCISAPKIKRIKILSRPHKRSLEPKKKIKKKRREDCNYHVLLFAFVLHNKANLIRHLQIKSPKECHMCQQGFYYFFVVVSWRYSFKFDFMPPICMLPFLPWGKISLCVCVRAPQGLLYT